MPDETVVTEEVASETPVQEKKEETPVQKIKLGEEEYDVPTLTQMLADAKRSKEIEQQAKQIKREGYKKFEEAAGLQKRFSAIQDIIHQDPEAGLLELAKIFGLPPEQIHAIGRNRAALEEQWSKLNDDQKARYIAEQKAQQLEAQQKAREDQEAAKKSTEELRQRQDAFEKKLSSDTLPAMQKAGLPQNYLTLKLVAATLGAIADRNGPDVEPSIDEAVDYVTEVYYKELEATLNAMDAQDFTKRYPGFSDKLRKYEVARATAATGKPQAGEPGKPAAPRMAPPKEDKKETWSDFSKRIRDLQHGRST